MSRGSCCAVAMALWQMARALNIHTTFWSTYCRGGDRAVVPTRVQSEEEEDVVGQKEWKTLEDASIMDYGVLHQ